MLKFSERTDDGSIESDRRLLVEMNAVKLTKLVARDDEKSSNGRGKEYWQVVVNGVFDASETVKKVWGKERPILDHSSMTSLQQLEIFRLRERLTRLLPTQD